MATGSEQQYKILLVDDHPFMQKVASQLIVSSGFKDIEVADSGASALENLEENPFQLVITDLELKKINGYDIVRKIRTGTKANNRDLPVLVMTTQTDAGLVTRCLMFDINGFIVKPVDQKDLTKKIISALSRKIRLKTVEEYKQVASGWTHSHGAGTGTNITNRTLQSLENAHQFLTTSIPVNEQGLVKVPLPVSRLGTGMSIATNVQKKDQSTLLAAGLVLNENHLNILENNAYDLLSGIIEVYMDVNRFKLITEVGSDE